MRTTTRSGRASLSSMIESGFAPRRSSSAIDADGLFELATVRRRAHVQRDGVLADHERHLAVGLDVDLLERRARRERRVLVVGREIERTTDGARGALAIVEELLEHDARDDREVRRVARLEALDDRALARDDVRLAACRLGAPVVRRDDAAGLALDDAQEDRAGQLARERCLAHPRIRDEARARAIEIGREDVLALRDARDARELVGRATLRAGRDDLGDREARARLDVLARAPRHRAADADDHEEADDATRDAHRARLARSIAAFAGSAIGASLGGMDAPEAAGALDARLGDALLRRVLPLGGGGASVRDGRKRAHGAFSFSSAATSSRALALMSPAPSAITRSPGRAISSSAAPIFFLSPM